MIYAILGPTCSGKSDIAEAISLKLNCPLINFDAFQVYKEIDKGTAKPPRELLESGRYFLYDFVDLIDEYDVSRYQKDARELLEKFKNQDVVLVGGTGLYLKALLFDYNFKEEEKMPADFLEDKTNQELYDELYKIDPFDAIKIGNNNRKRLVRALYVYKIHGKSKSELNDNGKNKLLYENVMFIGLNMPRDLLYERINRRVDLMFEDGLSEEVENLFAFYSPNRRAFQAIGYKEFNSDLSNDEVKELIKKNTRNYAKRQMTFFKHQFENVHWCKNIDEVMELIIK